MKLTSVLPPIKSDKVQTKRSQGVSSSRPAAVGTPIGADKVQLSSGSMDVQKMKGILQETPEVRMERIQALKEQIERGEYEVDPYRVADKMLMSLLSESFAGD